MHSIATVTTLLMANPSIAEGVELQKSFHHLMGYRINVNRITVHLRQVSNTKATISSPYDILAFISV